MMILSILFFSTKNPWSCYSYSSTALNVLSLKIVPQSLSVNPAFLQGGCLKSHKILPMANESAFLNICSLSYSLPFSLRDKCRNAVTSEVAYVVF